MEPRLLTEQEAADYPSDRSHGASSYYLGFDANSLRPYGLCSEPPSSWRKQGGVSRRPRLAAEDRGANDKATLWL